MNNNLSKKELAEIVGGSVSTLHTTDLFAVKINTVKGCDDINNNNNTAGCKCTYPNASIINNSNTQVGCSCECNTR
jgi:bacteriocin-like protein